jgi:polyhydroxyalkanoate synthesis regulator phasin
MSKENKQVATTTVETIDDSSLDNINKLNKDAFDQAAETLKKEHTDMLVGDAKEILQFTTYFNLYKYAALRKSRKYADAAKKAAADSLVLLEDVKAGKFTKNEWKAKLEEMKKNERETQSAADKEYKDKINEIDSKFKSLCLWNYNWVFDRR